MTTLVTGGTGFAGASLVEQLVARGHRVVAVSRTGQAGQLEGSAGARIRACDLTRPEDVSHMIDEIRPERIFHLAARTFVPDAHRDASGFLETNLMGTVHLLEAVRRHVPGCRVLVVGSAGVYGGSGQVGTQLVEEAPLRPVEPYGASKAAAELWARQASASWGLEVVCVRPFGHIGPRQSPRFVAADFARQIGRIRSGEQPPVIEVGNLEPIREFNDVSDIAAGHRAALGKGASGRVYNLCSGRGLAVRDLLSLLLQRSGVEAEIQPRPERMRPTDVPSLVGDPSRAREDLGWQVRVSLEESVDRLLERWDERGRRAESTG